MKHHEPTTGADRPLRTPTHGATDVADPSGATARSDRSWMAALATGDATAALTFAGQGSAWLDELCAIWSACPAARTVVTAAASALVELSRAPDFRFSGAVGDGLDLLTWIRDPTARPGADYLASSVVSQPGIFLTQVCRYVQLREVGLAEALGNGAIKLVAGHSQGVMAAVLVAEAVGKDPRGAVDPERCATFARTMAWQGLWMRRSWRRSPACRQAGAPMAAVAGLRSAQLQELIARFALERPSAEVIVALHNTPTRHVVSGAPRDLEALRRHLEDDAAAQQKARKSGLLGGSLTAARWDALPVEAAYHSVHMADGVEGMIAAVAQLGLTIEPDALGLPVLCPETGALLQDAVDSSEALVRKLVAAQFVGAVGWRQTCATIAAAAPTLVIDLGPGVGVQRLTGSNLRGHGVEVLPMAAPSGRDALLAEDRDRRPAALRYRDFGPRLQRLAGGDVRVDNRFSRATGQPPVLMGGMTPTTVDVPIVAAAANAGYVAELAGGGQVTEAVFQERVAELQEELAPGREVVFNALYLDRYLWDLHLGKRKVVQRARRQGAPIRGVTISAGVPPVDEGAALLEELNAAGLWLNAFKPGTVAQIDAVIAIAEAAPQHQVFVHVEGGKAGGHHSWEDLEALLLARYDALRKVPNVILCVGGGVGTPERAVQLLTGAWSVAAAGVVMPVDAVFLGTVAMACKEAKTSAAVKRALASAAGTSRWVLPGDAEGGVTSGKSQLDADIHYLANAAARCGRLLDEVAGNEEAVRARREEIIAALAATAKPYFGDMRAMSWRAVIDRAVALMAVGDHGRYEDGCWPDRTYRERVAALVKRAEARAAGAAGHEAPAASVIQDLAQLDHPESVLKALVKRWPAVRKLAPSATDLDWFVHDVCSRPGKPVNFVPVLDANVRRWFKSDSLWQAHNDRYDADAVLVIPGPEALAGLVADEPVGALLGRFERALIEHLQGAGAPIDDVLMVRRHALSTAIPGAIRVERGGDVTTWRVVGAASADAWWGPLQARFSGPIAALAGCRRLWCDGRADANPVRALCPAAPGAVLWLEHDGAALRRLTWRRDGEPASVVLSADGEQVHVAVHPTPMARADGTPVGATRSLADDDLPAWSITAKVLPDGTASATTMPAAAIAGFYHHHLFGEPLVSVPLFGEATAAVTMTPEQLEAYAQLAGGASGAPSAACFSLVFRPLMAALSCEELAGDLLRLVHLHNRVDLVGDWPPRRRDLVARARICRVEQTADGVLVTAVAGLQAGDQEVASLRSGFLLRGARAPATLRACEQLHVVLALPDAASASFLSTQPLVALVDGVSLAAGDALSLDASIRSEVADGRRAHWAEGVLVRDGAQVGVVRLDVQGGAEVAAQHPLHVLAELLAPAGPAPTAAKTLARSDVQAIADVEAWALVSDDGNPIHRCAAVARLAGLDAPIVHGMWTAARAEAFVVTQLAEGDQGRVRGFEAQFVAPVVPAEPLRFTARRVGQRRGALRLEIEVAALREERGGAAETPVLRAFCELQPPVTAYVLPGQGIQRRGMGMDAYRTSAAARATWDRADACTRARLGFSLLRVVRDNPRRLLVGGELCHHPDGVLHLTQFTQVAMAVLASAQVAQLEEAGALVAGAITCGHSVGEYNALSAVVKVLPLEAVIEIVWQRGLTMHTCVPRDALGRSGYAMGVIRPHYAGLTEAEALALVADVAAEQGFVEVVNHNVRGRQYSVVGEVGPLAALAERVEALCTGRGARKPAWIAVPGIDVPFHSTRLRPGVATFRATLQQRLPEHGDYLALVGRYIPNLVGRPFALDKPFVQAMVDATGDPALHKLVSTRVGRKRLKAGGHALARELLIELLAYQFASPVRWIETQQRMFRPVEAGGLGARRVVELGVGYQPTIANMARQTLAMMPTSDIEVLHVEVDAAALLGLGEDEPAQAAAPVAPQGPDAGSPAAATRATAPSALPLAAPAASGPADRAFDHGDAVRCLLALQAGMRPDQVADTDTIDDVFGGVSSRRNQALVDIGAEFGCGAIDGAHELPLVDLVARLQGAAPRYRAPGSYLTRAWDDAVRAFAGRARVGRAGLQARLQERYGLGEGLLAHALAAVALERREGDSARGGPLGACPGLEVQRAGALDDALDLVAAAAGERLGVSITPLAAVAGPAAAVDAAVVQQLRDELLGADGVLQQGLAALAERVQHAAGRGEPAPVEGRENAENSGKKQLAALAAEHGEGWAEQVAPRFLSAQHVAFTSSWAWAQRDVAALAADLLAGRREPRESAALANRLAQFSADPRVAQTARWHARIAKQRGRADAASLLRGIAAGKQRPLDRAAFLDELLDSSGGDPAVTLEDGAARARWREVLAAARRAPASFSGRTALVTGASPGSIGIELVGELLRGGARVVLTTSSPTPERVLWYRRLFQTCCAPGAELHVVPFNAASHRDVDALLDWLFSEVVERDGATATVRKVPMAPDIVAPFAALSDLTTLDELGPRAELTLRAMLLSVHRLVAGIGARYRREGMPATPCHVLLPMSPNLGGFGGDGAYAEAKAALQVLANKQRSERDAWGEAVRICEATIGWVRGTGLMAANDPVARALEERAGARTFSSAEMGWLLATLCTDAMRSAALEQPLRADLTGRFGRIADVRALVSQIRSEQAAQVAEQRGVQRLRDQEAAALGTAVAPVTMVRPLPATSLGTAAEAPAFSRLSGDLAQTVVIVGAGELGPCGSSRTRWAMEVDDALAPAAVLEMAWLCGMVRYERGRWLDAQTEQPVAEEAIAERYRDAVMAASGIRWTQPEQAGFDPEAMPVLATAYLERDFRFPVATEEEARSFLLADPAKTRIAPAGDDGWLVTRMAGAEVRVPRKARLNRRVLGTVPDGFDLGRMGIPTDMIGSVDQAALFNLVATADAFLDAGMSPEELLAHVHPARVANTQGSGIGGMRSLQRLYTDHLLDRPRQNDTLQETLINVIAAYVVQSYVGSYGSMAHPVGACATAAVSLEEAMDKILAGRADFVIAGGYDDVGPEGAVGFSDMGATCATDQMLQMGLQPRQMSRANDARRRGFVEAQGGGTLLLCRGDVAAKMGLPVRGVLAWAGSFSDGIHRSIPAPGMGVLAAAMGGAKSPISRALRKFGLGADDIGLVYKHDTSTAANDPNENALHDGIQTALGRTAGNPLFVVSQKTLTGHSKGGAAAWQAIGLCQALRDNVIPGNRNLDEVDPAMRSFGHVAFTDTAIRGTPGGLKAGLVTSLGFGHVGALALVVHPAAFAAMLSAKQRKRWKKLRTARRERARQQRMDVHTGERALFERRGQKRFSGDAERRMLLDPAARLSSPASAVAAHGGQR